VTSFVEADMTNIVLLAEISTSAYTKNNGEVKSPLRLSLLKHLPKLSVIFRMINKFP